MIIQYVYYELIIDNSVVIIIVVIVSLEDMIVFEVDLSFSLK